MKKAEAKHIVNYLKENQESMILFLKKLVEAESPSTDANSQVKVINLLKSALEELNFYVLQMPGKKTGGFILARPLKRLKNNPIQFLLGHCDTVWDKETILKMPIIQDKFTITGPGIFDMKAGLTQMIYSIQTIRDLKLNCPLTPVILINSDEEIGSKESKKAIVNISKIANRAFILEPPLGIEGKLKTARKGIGRFTLTVKGKPAHAGLNPDKGVSAIVELSYHIQYLFELNDFKKGITVNVGMIEGGTSANVIAAESRAVIDVRVHNNKDAEFISKKILGLKPINKDIELLVEGYFGRPPMEKTNRNQKLWKMAKNLGELIDLELEESTAGGGSDGNTTSMYTATLDGLGTIGDGAHAKHEFIFTDKLIERTALLTILLTANSIKNNYN
ncbi:MAG: M20 family metallopeptidase [Flavobacteriaceae bacterium]|nr:M20 family metallopeptidase [Flavobacteriaceae bacterium]